MEGLCKYMKYLDVYDGGVNFILRSILIQSRCVADFLLKMCVCVDTNAYNLFFFYIFIHYNN